MIRINISYIDRYKIKAIFDNYIEKMDVVSKINVLIEELNKSKYTNVAKLLSEYIIDNELFYIFGKKELYIFAQKFDNAVSEDCKKNSEDKKQIISLIRNGRKAEGKGKRKKVYGFDDFYDWYSKSDEAYEILNILNVNVCPYCNRQYTFSARKGELKSRPQFDHFFPKSIYPFLSISLYNLIPSCALCNSGKSDGSPLDLLYPYEESFESHNIYFSIDEIVPYLLKFQKSIKILLESSNLDDEIIINSYYSNYKIKLLYEGHSDYIKGIIEKKCIFNDDALESICKSYPDGVITPIYLEQLIFGKYEVDDFINHPLSKFTSDVFKQL